MIRQARLKDAEMVRILLEQLGYCPELAQVGQALVEHDGDDTSTIYVYEFLEEIVGFISIVRFFYFPTMHRVMRITALCVSEPYRNRGFGGELLRFIEALARESDHPSIEITCSFHREQAHQFYLHHVYTQHSYKFIKHLLR